MYQILETVKTLSTKLLAIEKKGNYQNQISNYQLLLLMIILKLTSN